MDLTPNAAGRPGRQDDRRRDNARALAAFGVDPDAPAGAGRIVRAASRPGAPPIHTIGYERRSLPELIALLTAAGVEHLADIRDRPASRRAEFRAAPIRAAAERAGIEYGPWTDLGSTDEQREAVRATADYEVFHRDFRAYAVGTMEEPLGGLGAIAAERRVALLCYERAHEECHRMVVADLLADRTGGGVVAL